MGSTLLLKTTDNFSFLHTVTGHGWYDLSPYSFDEEKRVLRCVFRDAAGVCHSVLLAGDDGAIRIETIETDDKVTDANELLDIVRHIVRLDEDMSGFYDAAIADKRFRWVEQAKAGRLLRSQTVFEDVVKTLCTTNCSWSLTRKMVANLVDSLGETTSDGYRAFPTAEVMASESADFYRDVIRAGYRSPYLAELAKLVASGGLHPEEWLKSELPTADLKREIKSIKGFGNYAAENLLKLLGRYDDLALDSWLRKQFYLKYNGGIVCSDGVIEKFYESFGEWRGLAFWCDMTESWFEKKAV